MTNQTGRYDRQAEAAKLTAANTDRIARDPFGAVPATDDEDADDRCATCNRRDHEAGTYQGHAYQPSRPGLVCGARTTTGGLCFRAPHSDEYPHYADPRHAINADADMPGAPAPAVDLWSGQWPYSTMSAADFAALYHAAGEIIKARGYFAYEAQGYADEPGISTVGALKAAALERAQAADPQGDPRHHYTQAVDTAEELETRLTCVLYLLGQLHNRTGIRDLSDGVAGWELGHTATTHGGTKAAALALLEQAAALFGLMADTTAPVTAAPEPGRM